MERAAQAKSLKPAGSELPPAVLENGKANLRTRAKAGWRAKAPGDMIESKPVDSLFASWSGAQGRVSPQHVADRLKIKRRAAKKILQEAAQRGVLVALPDGWYEVASRQPHYSRNVSHTKGRSPVTHGLVSTTAATKGTAAIHAARSTASYSAIAVIGAC